MSCVNNTKMPLVCLKGEGRDLSFVSEELVVPWNLMRALEIEVLTRLTGICVGLKD